MKKKILGRLLAVALSATMVLSLVGCGSLTTGSSDSTSSSSGATSTATDATSTTTDAASTASHILDNGRYDKIVIAAATDPQDLEPDQINVDPRYYFIYDVYESLFDWSDDGSGELVPCLAESYEVVDGTTWKVTLHNDIHDSDGNNITANDVAYSFNYLVNSGNAIRFDYFDSIEVLDDYTFNIHWTSEPPALSELEFPLTRTLIFSQKAYEDRGSMADDPCGTGCYTVSDFVTGSKLVLEANDNYWGTAYIDKLTGRHKANVQTVEFDVIPEASTAVVGLETGKIDVCGYVPISMQDEFATGDLSDQYQVQTIVQGDYWYVAPNCENLDINLRKAIFYALDNSAVAKAMGGSYVPCTTFGNSAYRDYDSSLEETGTYITDYDLDKAKEYLAKSNYNGESLTIITVSDEAAKAATQMMQTLLLQVGIKTDINATTSDNLATITAYGSGQDWDMVVKTIGGPSMVGSWHLLFDNEVQNGYTTSFVKDDKLQELYDAAGADATHDAAHMKACMDYVIDNAYMYPLVGQSTALVFTKNISNMYYREGYYYPSASSYVGQ